MNLQSIKWGCTSAKNTAFNAGTDEKDSEKDLRAINKLIKKEAWSNFDGSKLFAFALESL